MPSAAKMPDCRPRAATKRRLAPEKRPEARDKNRRLAWGRSAHRLHGQLTAEAERCDANLVEDGLGRDGVDLTRWVFAVFGFFACTDSDAYPARSAGSTAWPRCPTFEFAQPGTPSGVAPTGARVSLSGAFSLA